MITSKFKIVEKEETDLRERKKRLRAHMKKRRADNENRDMKERLLIENTFRLLDKIQGAGTPRTVFCYLSYSSEAPTDGLMEALRESGFEVYCPRVEGKEIVPVLLGEDISLSSLGIREPIGEAYTGEMDIVILPLLAVDEKGNRLGYGGGYYDRYLSKHGQAKRIGYCFDFQVLPFLPSEETDERLDYIVTDKRVIKTQRL